MTTEPLTLMNNREVVINHATIFQSIRNPFSMKTLYRLSIDPTQSLEQAWNHLEETGIDILYGSEEEGTIELFAHLSSPHDLPHEEWITSCEPYTLPTIDWEAQWETHGHNFQNGCVNIDLSSCGKSNQLRLQPGSGFGDLSHPTTRLMLNMLAESINHQTVVDIGCGSGILTLAAAAMELLMFMGLILILKLLSILIKMLYLII